jgi:hypothetical protein
MAQSLKQQLANRPDATQRTIALTSVVGEPITVTIRRVTVQQRDRLIRDYHLGADAAKEEAVAASIAIVTMALVAPEGEEPVTEEEVRAMPAAIVDEVATAVMDFNGWTKVGKAALDDQFRPAT